MSAARNAEIVRVMLLGVRSRLADLGVLPADVELLGAAIALLEHRQSPAAIRQQRHRDKVKSGDAVTPRHADPPITRDVTSNAGVTPEVTLPPPLCTPPSAATYQDPSVSEQKSNSRAAAALHSSAARERNGVTPDVTLRGVLAGVLDGVGGASTSRKDMLRLERAEPLLRRLAVEQGADPVELFEVGWRRFKADPEVRRQRYGAAVFLAQLEQWCQPDAAPERTAGEIRAEQSAADLERMKREQADDAGRDVPTAAEIRALTAGIGRRVAS